jgi:NADPH:quinone reductase-like Zn-dependent oxidoreductase
MRAVTVHGYGGVDVLAVTDVPTPEPQRGEVRVKVAAAAVNRTDINARTGLYGTTDPGPAGFRLGMDVSGIVDAVGDGVTDPPIGAAVVGFLSSPNVHGGQAEYAVLPADGIAPAPRVGTLEQAAALPLNGLTAAQTLAEAELADGAVVVVTGAAGGLGWFIVQLFHLAGYRVIALVKPGTNAGEVSATGADEVVTAIGEIPRRGFDAVIDAATIVQDTIDLIRDGGLYIDFRHSRPDLSRGIRHHGVSVKTNGTLLSELVAKVDAGTIRLPGAEPRPLDEVASAQHDLDGGGIRNRLVLVP